MEFNRHVNSVEVFFVHGKSGQAKPSHILLIIANCGNISSGHQFVACRKTKSCRTSQPAPAAVPVEYTSQTSRELLEFFFIMKSSQANPVRRGQGGNSRGLFEKCRGVQSYRLSTNQLKKGRHMGRLLNAVPGQLKIP